MSLSTTRSRSLVRATAVGVFGVASIVTTAGISNASTPTPTPSVSASSTDAASTPSSAVSGASQFSSASAASNSASATKASASSATPSASATTTSSASVNTSAARVSAVNVSAITKVTIPSIITADTTKSVVINGTATNAKTSDMIELYLYYPSSKKWLPYMHTYVSSKGTFSFTETYGQGTLNKYQFKAVDTAASANGANSSTTVTMDAYSDFTPASVTSSLVYRTYHAGCPVTPSMLTKLNMNYYGFDGKVHQGYVVVRSKYLKNFEAAFSQELASRFPIRQMHDPSVYGNDMVSMAADNTYAFYCRPVTGNPSVLSPHSYGTSVDVNTVENPYEEPDGTWTPSNGRSYVNRSIARPGMLFYSTPFTKAFLNNGFKWLYPFDYQHFQIR